MSYPYPLSGVVLDTLALAQRWQHGEAVPNLPFDVCRATGLLLRMNAALAIGALAASAREIPALNSEVVAALRSPSDGAWHNLTRRLLKGLKSGSTLFLALDEALKTKVALAKARVPGAQDSPNRPAKKAATAQLLSELITYRNTVIHGDRLNDQAHAKAVAKLEAVVEAHGFYAGQALLVRDGQRFLDCRGPQARWLEQAHTPDWWTAALQTAAGDLAEWSPTLISLAAPTERLSVSGLLHYTATGRSGIQFDDLFFLNRGTVQAAEYIAYRFEGHADAQALGSYEAFRELIAQLPAPPIPKEKRLAFDGLAEFHAQRFIGREEVLAEIGTAVKASDHPYVELRALAGMGKTAIMARLYADQGGADAIPWPAPGKKQPQPPEALPPDQPRWVFHFCMPTDGRDNPLVALQNLVSQLCDGAGLQRSAYLAAEIDAQQHKFVQCLHKVREQLAAEARIIVCIDALDEGIPSSGRYSVPNVLPGSSDDDEALALPEGVVFLVSYRVDESGHSRADDHLEQIPSEWRVPLAAANPLKGLARPEVSDLLAHLGDAVGSVPLPGVVDAVWAAATRDHGEDQGADPFYLRFLGDDVLEGAVSLERPETVPADLNTVFEALWMRLPRDHGFALHRILATLALLREYATDELMGVLINQAQGNGTALTGGDIQLLRSAAGKLLVYDGDRYGVFHDRFRWFLVGRRCARLDMALARHERVDASGRFGPRQCARLHQALGNLAGRWNDADLAEPVRAYALHHGPHHLLMAAEVQAALTVLTDYPAANERLCTNRSDPWVEDIETAYAALQQGAVVAEPDALRLWESFAREHKHILARGDDDWPANKILLQLAAEHADNSPITAAAEGWLDQGRCDWLWLRNARRPEVAIPSPCIRVFEGHTGGVRGAKVLPDGRILSWSSDGTLRLWDGKTGEALTVLEGHTDSVNGVELLSDGRILSWSRDNTLHLWNGDSGKALGVMEGHTDKVWGARILPDGRILSWSEDNTLRLWDGKTGEALAVLEGHTDSVKCVELLSDGRILSWCSGYGSTDTTLRLWDTDTGKTLAVLEGHTDSVAYRGVEVLPNGRILSWSDDKTLRLWDGKTGEALAVLEGHTDYIRGARILPDGRILSWGDNTLRLWDSDSGKALGVMEAHTDKVWGARILPDGRILSWSRDSTLRLWDGDSGKALGVMEGHTERINGVELLPDGRILSWSGDKTLRLWDGDSGKELGVMEGHTSRSAVAELLPDGRILSWSTMDNTPRLWDGQTGEALAVLEGHTYPIGGVELLPDGRILSWSRDKTLRLWDGDSGKVLGVMEGHTDSVTDAELLPDGRILSRSGDLTPRLWDGQTGEALAVLEGHTDTIRGVELLPDGRILSWSRDKTLRLWDGDSGKVLGVMEGHTDSVTDAELLPDGRILSWSSEYSTYGSIDQTLRLWDSNTGEALAVMEGHIDFVKSVELLPDGRILSWSADNTLRLWDGDSGKALAVLEGHTDIVNGAKLLPDGRILSWSGDSTNNLVPHVVEATADNTLRLWDGDSGKALGVMEGHTDRVLGAQFLPNDHILSWSYDSTLCLWDSKNGKTLSVMEGHTDRIMGVEVLPDGRILSWSGDNTLRLWDGDNGKTLGVMEGHTDKVTGVEHLPDGRILSWSYDTTLRLWDGGTGKALAVLEGHTDYIWDARILPDGRILSWSRDNTLRLWDGKTGHSIQALIQRDAFWRESALFKATVVDRLISGNAFGIDLVPAISIHSPKFGKAQWHVTGTATPTNLLSSGTLVATMHRHLLFLQPHVGNQRVPLEHSGMGIADR